MSDTTLPKTVDPLKYADQDKVLEGHLSIHLMPRLAETLVESTGEVDVKLIFGRDAQNLRVLNGELTTRLLLTCQRCLQPVETPIQSRFSLGIVLNDEQAQNLPRVYEPLLVEPDKLVVLDVIEEELILSLPMFAYHDDCVIESGSQAEHKDNEGVSEKTNPFSVLSELKKQD